LGSLLLRVYALICPVGGLCQVSSWGSRVLEPFSEKIEYYMWGKISKVPLPDFEPLRGNPLGNLLEESPERKAPRGIP